MAVDSVAAVVVEAPSGGSPSSMPVDPAAKQSAGRAADPADADVVYGGVRGKIIAMSMELEDKAQTIALLKDSVKKGRVALEAAKRHAEVTLRDKLKAAKASSEAALKRQLEFADALLADKAALSEKVEQLSAELRRVEAGWSSRLRAAKERAAVDLKRAQNAWAAAERQRRDAWMRDKAAAIQKSTLAGLEPEVQRILDRQKQEIAKLRNGYDARLAAAVEEAKAAHGEEMARVRASVDDRVRAQVATEVDALAARERRLRDEVADEVAAIRQRSAQALEDEQSRHADMMRAERERQVEEVARLRRAYEDIGAGVRAATQAEEVRERSEWKRTMLAQLHAEMSEREREIRAAATKQRDEQVQMVIARLDGDMRRDKAKITEERDAAVRHVRHELEDKLRDMAARHEEEASRLARAAQEWEAKFNALNTTHASSADQLTSEAVHLRRELGEAQRAAARAEATVADLRRQLATTQELAARDRERLVASHAAEVAEAVAAKQQALAQLEVATQAAAAGEAAARHAAQAEVGAELAAAQQQLTERDALVDTLKAKLQDVDLRRHYAEQLLAKQRRELLASPRGDGDGDGDVAGCGGAAGAHP